MSTSAAPEQIVLPETLRGARVLLRPYRAADAEAVLAAIDESREHLRPWVGWGDRYTTLEETRGYCERCAAAWEARSDLSLGIFDRASGVFFGGAGLHHPDWNERTFEISCWLRASAAYRGYGTEALRLLAALAFSDLDAALIKLHCDARNGPTRRLADKCGYVFRGRVRDGYDAPDGQIADLLVYALTPEDWTRAQSPLPS
jgi:ribosomal-protein-serine acetyltransferase